jgi:hypothetical protein
MCNNFQSKTEVQQVCTNILETYLYKMYKKIKDKETSKGYIWGKKQSNNQ